MQMIIINIILNKNEVGMKNSRREKKNWRTKMYVYKKSRM